MRIVVVGGAGAMGRIVVKDLDAFFTDAHLVIADYDETKARELAATVKGGRASGAFIDVTDSEGAARVMKGALVVINSAPYQWNLHVMEAALLAGCHYVDLGGLFHMTRKQLELGPRFEKAGRLAVLGMGAAPGIANLLARVGADELDQVSEIHIRVGGRDTSRYAFVPALPVSYSLKTILEEFSSPPAVFTKGRFAFVEPMSGEKAHRFPAPVGVTKPFYTLHSEVATLPLSFRKKGVKEVTFKIAFDDTFVERVRFLRDMGFASHEPMKFPGGSIPPIEFANRVAMSQPPPKRVGALKQHEIVRAIVKGKRGGKKLTVVADCHTAGMPKWGIGTDVNTGCPPAIAAQMLAAGEITATGALPPEEAVPAAKFFARLAKRKMTLKVSRRGDWEMPV